MAAGAGHDLANLLTAIRGQTDLAARTLGGGHAGRRHLALIAEAAVAAEKLARSLVEQADREGSFGALVNLSALVTDTAELIRGLMPDGVAVQLAVEQYPDLWINGDDSSLRRLLLNLGDNARKAMPRGGRLDISLHAEPAASSGSGKRDTDGAVVARLDVADTGLGLPGIIPPGGPRPRAARRLGNGYGLGLPLVWNIVADHGGRVAVRSTAAAGTCFSIRFPLAGQVPCMGGAARQRSLVRRGLRAELT